MTASVLPDQETHIRNHARILIVDDDRVARTSLSSLLAEQPYQLFTAATATDALKRLDQIQPDVILLDVLMPEMDGYEFCRRLKNNPVWQHIPIILVTALDDFGSLVTGLDAGADEFLSKPVHGPELRARIRSMLRIKRQYDQLQQALQLREDIANMMIHDLRNPLSVAMLKCNLLLLRNQLQPLDVDSVELIYSQLARLDAFVDDMLMLARMEGDSSTLLRRRVDVCHEVATVLKEQADLATSTDIDLHIDVPDTPCWIEVDVALFVRVVDNLLSHALLQSPRHGRVQFAITSLTDGSLRLSVTDMAPAIPPEYRTAVFDKFEIVALKQKGINQMDLRLAFCKQVVDAHGGTITYSTETSGGNRITAVFPPAPQ